jgi:hypothetical protein
MSDQALMQFVKEKWGALIQSTVSGGPLPASFLAAMVANESGGNENAKRFEPHVLSSLWQVLLGRTAAYGSIGGQDLVKFVTDTAGVPAVAPRLLPADAFQRFDSLATSWGLTQIMGYEAIAFQLVATVDALKKPETELPITVRMLKQFAQRNALDLAKDFSELFDCWNTGRPHAQTADPEYIPNGLGRMKLYEALA